MRIIHSNQLAQCIITVRRLFAVPGFRRDVSPAVIRIRKVHRIGVGSLRYRRDQRRRRACAILCRVARHVAICGFIYLFPVRHLPARDSVQRIIRILYLVIRIIILDCRRSVILVIRVACPVTAFRRLFREVFQPVLSVVLQCGTINQFLCLQVTNGFLHRTFGKVVLHLLHAVQVLVLHTHRLSVCSVLVRVSGSRFSIILHARQPVVLVVLIPDLSAVPVLHFFQHPASVVFVDISRQQLLTHFYFRLAAKTVIVERVRHIAARVARRIVAHRLNPVIFIRVRIFVRLAARYTFYLRHAVRRIISIVHRLPGRIRYAGQRVRFWVHRLCHCIAARIPFLVHIVVLHPFRQWILRVPVVVIRLYLDRCFRIVDLSCRRRLRLIPVRIVFIRLLDSHRRGAAAQKMPLLLRIRRSVRHHVLLRARRAWLHVFRQVVKAVVLHRRLRLAQVRYRQKVLLVVVCKRFSVLLPVYKHVAEHRRLRVPRIVDAEYDGRVRSRRYHRPAAVLPADPFPTEIQILPCAVCASVHKSIRYARCIFYFLIRVLRHALRVHPAAHHKRIALLARYRQRYSERYYASRRRARHPQRVPAQRFRHPVPFRQHRVQCVAGDA